MKKKFYFILILAVTAVALLTACTTGEQTPVTDSEGNSVSVVYANIDYIVAADEETVSETGFLLDAFQLSDIHISIVYKSGDVLDTVLTESMIRAEDKAKLSVVGTHSVTVYYGKFWTTFSVKLYTETEEIHSVTFLDWQGNRLGDVQYLKANEAAVVPSLESREGYEFVGWKRQGGSDVVTDFVFTENTTLVASYIASYFEVEYYYLSNGEYVKTVVNVPRGMSALDYAPSIPTEKGHSNGRWVLTSDLQSVVKDGLKFYATYDEDYINVTFVYYKYTEGVWTNYQVNWKTGSETEGISEPDDARKTSEYTFMYWYTKNIYGEETQVTFPYVLSGEVTFYARYVSLTSGTDGLQYTFSDGVYYISDYTGKDTTVTIPAFYDDGINGSANVVGLTGSPFKGKQIEMFRVAAGNGYFRTYDDVLYTMDLSTLLAYPIARDNTVFEIASQTVNPETIAEYAFYGAKNLIRIELPQSLTTIRAHAFENATALTEISVTPNVSTVGDYAFAGATSAKGVSFSPDAVPCTVGDGAFSGLNAVQTVTLPGSLESLGQNVFAGCRSLEEFYIVGAGDRFQVYYGALYGAKGTAENYYLYAYPSNYSATVDGYIKLHERVKEILPGAFSYAEAVNLTFNSNNNILFRENSIVSPNLGSIYLICKEVTFRENAFAEPDGSDEYIPSFYFGEDATVRYTDEDGNTVAECALKTKIDAATLTEMTEYKPAFTDGFVFRLVGSAGSKTAELSGYRGSAKEVYVPSKIEGYTVTAVKENILKGNGTVEKLIFASDVVIGEKAFFGCTALKEVVFQSTVTKLTLGDYAFGGCTALKKVEASASLKVTYGYQPFEDAPYLKENAEVILGNILVAYNGTEESYTVPGKIYLIADYAFEGCSGLLNLRFDEDSILSEVRSYAFAGCEGVQEIVFTSETLSAVGESAFAGCIHLFAVVYQTPVVVPASAYANTATAYGRDECMTVDNTEPVHSYRFGDITQYGYYILKAPDFPTDEKYIGWFTDVGYTVAARFPYEVKKDVRFYTKVKTTDTENIVYGSNEDGTLTVASYKGNDVTVVVPETVSGKKVASVGKNAFYGKEVSYFYLPSSIASVGEGAFDGTAWIGNQITDTVILGNILVRYRGASSDFVLPSSVTVIADGAFRGNTSLKTVTVHDGITNIPTNCFYGCSSLEKVTLGKKTLSVGAYAFRGCPVLSEINFDELTRLNAVDGTALDGTAWLNGYVDDNVIINNIYYRYIGYNLYNNGTELTAAADIVHIPNSITRINDWAFYQNETVKYIYLPESITAIGKYAFAESNINTVFYPVTYNNLTDIEEGAFFGCKEITSVNIDSCTKLATIGKLAFAECEAGGDILNIRVPASVSVIEEEAFARSSLNSVVFSSGSRLQIIERGTFADCRNLNSVRFEGGSYLIGVEDDAFANCTALASFVNKDCGLQTIGNNAFSGCVALSEFTVSEAELTYIGEDAFRDTLYLNQSVTMLIAGTVLLKYNGIATQVHIPKDITVISNGAFRDNERLEEIIFDGNNVVEIQSDAFRGCEQLVSVHVPNSVEHFGTGVWAGCISLTDFSASSVGGYISVESVMFSYDEETKTAKLLSYPNNKAYTYAVPASVTVDGYPYAVTEIADYAFYNCDNVVSVTLSDNIVSVGKYAFCGCAKLTNITVGAKVVSLGDYAFGDCVSVASVVLPDSVKTIGEGAFCGCKKLASVTLPEGLVSVAAYAWKNCAALKETVLPTHIESVGNGAFEGCRSLEKLTLPFIGKTASETNGFIGSLFGASSYTENGSVVPSSLKKITVSAEEEVTVHDYALYGCASLTELVLPATVTEIGRYAMAYCTSLSALNVQGATTVIGHGAFYRCDGLASLTVPTLRNGETETFLGDLFGAEQYSDNGSFVPSALKTVELTYATALCPYAFYGCATVEKVVLPSTVTIIPEGAFGRCVSLTDFDLPSGVTTIGEQAFVGCALTEIDFPETLLAVGAYAFDGCASLTAIALPKNVNSVGECAFVNCSSVAAVTVHEDNTEYFAQGNCLLSAEKHLLFGCKNSVLTLASDVVAIDKGAFRNCNGLTELIVPSSITYIGEEAFFGCSSLEELIFPDCLLTVERDILVGCDGLQSLTVPFIGQSATSRSVIGYFFGTTDAEEQGALLPSSLSVTVTGNEDIMENTFYGCGTLVGVSVGAGVQNIGKNAFKNCVSLSSFVFPSALTTVGDNAFEGCEALTSIALQAAVSSVGKDAFTDCGALESITVSDLNTVYTSKDNCLVENATKSMILGCKNSVIPNDSSVTNIASHAFCACEGLSSVSVPGSVTSIGKQAIRDCDDLVSIELPFVGGSVTENTYIGYIFGGENVGQNNEVLPSGLSSFTFIGCASIPDNGMKGCKNVTEINLPDTLKSIGEGAFYGCSALLSVDIPQSVKEIDTDAFYGCVALENVYTEDVTAWAAIDFANIAANPTSLCGKLSNGDGSVITEIHLTSGLKVIGDYAFYGCKELTLVDIPASVESIGVRVFDGCTNIATVTVPFIGESVDPTNKYFGYLFGAAGYNQHMAKVPESLKNVTLLYGNMTVLPAKAFYSCDCLEYVSVPSSVTQMGSEVFYGCSSLTELSLPFTGATAQATSNGHIGYLFGSDEGKKNALNVPKTLTTVTVVGTQATFLADEAFYGCEGINTVTFSSETVIASIGKSCFENCTSVAEIALPNTVTAVGGRAFCGCEMLATVTVGDNLLAVGKDAFSETAWLDAQSNGVVTVGKVLYTYKGTMPDNTELAPTGIYALAEYAFAGQTALKSITLTNDVKYIGEYAFSACSSVQSMTLPFVGESESATKNNYLAYLFGTGSMGAVPNALKELSLTGGQTVLADNTFFGCSSLTTIHLNIPLVGVGNKAFYNCSSLEAISLPATVQTVGQEAFYGCASLESVSLPASVTSVGFGAFSYCDGITEISVPFVGGTPTGSNNNFGYIFGVETGATVAGDSMPDSLRKVTVFGDITEIAESAFVFFNALTEVEITSPALEKIGKWAFRDCTALTTVTVPSSVYNIGSQCFAGTAWLNNQPNGAIYVQNVLYQYKGIIPSESRNFTVRADTVGITGYAMYERTEMTAITLPATVRYIGEYAFGGCTGLTVFEIPAAVTDLENNLLDSCTGLLNVVIPEGVKSIGKSVFFGCKNLKSVTLPSTLKSIGNGAFDSCTGLTSMTVPDSVDSIAINAFYKCSALASVTLPYIGGGIGGTGNTHFGYIFGASVPEDNDRFVPESVMNVTITGQNGAMKQIAEKAFFNCSHLRTITLPQCVTEIMSNVFMGCSDLRSLVLPFLGQCVDDDEHSYLGYFFGATKYLENAAKVPGTLSNISFVDGCAMTVMGEGAFYGCDGLSDVEIPDTVTEIGEIAFSGCSSLSAITVPTNLETIGGGAFSECVKIRSITVPNSVTSIGKGILYGCTLIETVTIPYINKELGELFNSDADDSEGNIAIPKSLTQVTVDGAGKVTSIPSSAFYGCNYLQNVVLPNSVKNIGDNAFSGCVALKNFTFPTSTETVGSGAFAGCSTLTALSLPDTVTSIGSNAFGSCVNLATLSVPFVGGSASGDTAFIGYVFGSATPTDNGTNVPHSLTTVVVTGGNAATMTLSVGALYGCAYITTLTLPACMTVIARSAFIGCSGLISVTVDALNTVYASLDNCLYETENKTLILGIRTSVLPTDGKIVAIGDGAFEDCLATAISLPECITSIGKDAFKNCSALTDITVPGGVRSVGASAFKGCSALASITLPFVGETSDNSTANTFFGYLFGADSADNNGTAVPTSLIRVTLSGGTGVSLAARAFYGCTGVKTVIVSDSIDVIGSGAFSGCTQLTELSVPFVGSSSTATSDTHFGYIFGAASHTANGSYVPASLKTVNVTGHSQCASIAENAFYNCSHIVSLTVSDRVTSIGKSALQNCSELATLVVPFVGASNGDAEEKTHFGYLFGATDSNQNGIFVPSTLKTVVLRNTATVHIRDNAFSSCGTVTAVNFECNVDIIGARAFSECVGIASMTVPNTVLTVGTEAFYGCTGFTAFTVPESVTSIGSGAFYGCSKLASLTVPFVGQQIGGATNGYLGYIFGASVADTGADNVVDALKTVTVTKETVLGEKAFYGLTSITGVTLPNTLTSIGVKAFAGCTALTAVAVPTSVTAIATDAYINCSAVTSVTVASDNTTFVSTSNCLISVSDKKLLFGCTASAIPTDGTVTCLSENAFYGCSQLTTLTVPNAVTAIGAGALTGCSKLTSLTLPFIGTSAASGSLFIGSLFGGTTYDSNASAVPKTLTTVSVVGTQMTALGENAFRGCKYITAITLNDAVTEIGRQAFDGCSKLDRFVFPNALTVLGAYAFNGCVYIRSVDLPKTLTTIGEGAFMGCESLSRVSAQYATAIEANAFKDCTALRDLLLGVVASIGNDAFNNCSDMSHLYFAATSTEISSASVGTGNDAFTGCTSQYFFFFEAASIDLTVGDSEIGATINIEPGLDSSFVIRYASGDTSVATVHETTGMVAAVQEGVTTETVTVTINNTMTMYISRTLNCVA